MKRCQNIISDIEDADIERMVIDKLLRTEMKTGFSGLYSLYSISRLQSLKYVVLLLIEVKNLVSQVKEQIDINLGFFCKWLTVRIQGHSLDYWELNFNFYLFETK